ncbi:hypothetical protein D3C72_2031740 [compost metagenome]
MVLKLLRSFEKLLFKLIHHCVHSTINIHPEGGRLKILFASVHRNFDLEFVLLFAEIDVAVTFFKQKFTYLLHLPFRIIRQSVRMVEVLKGIAEFHAFSPSAFLMMPVLVLKTYRLS